jgi:uncharacterized protein (TIGR03382 family)
LLWKPFMMRTLLAFTLCSLPTLAFAAKTIDVDRLDDPLATGPIGDFCTAASSDCSLRQAVRVANEDTTNSYTVTLPAGTIALSRGLISVAARPTVIQGQAGGTSVISGAINGNQKIFSFDGTGGVQSLTLRTITFKSGHGGDPRKAMDPQKPTLPPYSPHPGLGGVIYIESAAFDLTLEDCRFTSSSATKGGAIYKDGGTLTIRNTTFDANNAADGGALFLSGSGGVTVHGSTLSRNSASGSGGAIFSQIAAQLRTFGTTISTNHAGVDGGGITVINPRTDSAAGAELAQTTVANNSADGDGGGLFNKTSTLSGIVDFANVIFAGNTAKGTGPNCTGSKINSLGSNLLSTLTGCNMTLKTSDLEADAQLLALANNGGTTLTHALTCGTSPAIDTACVESDAFSLSKCVGIDQRGFARPTRLLRDKGAVEMMNADYGVALAGPTAAIAANTDFTYTATVSNAGPEQVPSGAKLLLTLAAGIVKSPAAALPAGCSISGQVITCALPQIAVATTTPFSFTLQANKGGQLSSTASVRSGACHDDAANNTATHLLSVTPRIAVADVAALEGNSNGERTITFTVTVTPTSNLAISFAAETQGLPAAPDAAAPGVDYNTLVKTTQTIAANTASISITVPLVGDTQDEIDEKFLLKLSAASGATFADDTAQGTIADDDATPPPPAPAVTLTGAQIAEGDGGDVDLTFTLTRPNGYISDLSYTVSAGAGTATVGTDYDAPVQIVFPAAALSLLIHSTVHGDTALETDESFTLTVSGNGSTVSAEGLILNDERTPVLSMDELRVTEGQDGEISALFLITLDEAPQSQLDFQVAFIDGTATQDLDYRVIAPAILSFAPGQSFAQLPVAIIGDGVIESDEEDFSLQLTDALGTTHSVRATIVDDDTPLDPVLDPPSDAVVPPAPVATPVVTAESPATGLPALVAEPTTPDLPVAAGTVRAKGCNAASDNTPVAGLAILLLLALRRRRA